MKVPLAYGPKQKFLARLDQNPDPTNKRVQITLPRISFEINGISYDPTRKVSPTQKIKFKKDNDENKNVYMPVPYNLSFELAIISKNQEDGLQILEQILPFFQPHYNLPVKILPDVDEVKDVPVTLTSVDYEDTYEGEFAARRAIIYTLQFTCKTYLYGPVTDAKIIKKVITDYYTDTNVNRAPREVRYTTTPTSLQDRDGVVVTTLSSATDTDDNLIAVADASGIAKFANIYIDTELIRVSKKSGNNLTVIRGHEGTAAAAHASGANVYLITEADNTLLDSDDDFGFGELKAEFTDLKKRNPISGADEAI
tara:strand:- start:164 stop:1096 length:933 start_codon:yes stop_codon:yes gene_type:complete